jgi:hypothetical protein
MDQDGNGSGLVVSTELKIQKSIVLLYGGDERDQKKLRGRYALQL